MNFVGMAGTGGGAVYVGNGKIVGIDAGSLRYSGNYIEKGGRMKETVNLYAPTGGTLHSSTGRQQMEPDARLWGAIFLASLSRLKSVGSRFRGDQTAENGMVSGSSRISRKATSVIPAAAPSSTKSENAASGGNHRYQRAAFDVDALDCWCQPSPAERATIKS
ncbi:hypothetical protein [Bradyrhizobium sp. LMG 9283]|uniref:hypothetical protein n=1 Tax=Bradyrhizobium sp. LMG 9283 TaxID=592064 RepID=UPI0038903A67